MLCACRPCSILFPSDSPGARFRLIPETCRYLDGFELDDEVWDGLRVPVELAFFFHSTAVGRVVVFYPGPAGATESQLPLPEWAALVARNPVLRELEPDVEALLVNRTHGAREYWIAPVDVCYRLVGVIRTHWRGLGGGEEVWREIDGFFDELRARA